MLLDRLQTLELSKELLTEGCLSVLATSLPSLRSLVCEDVTLGRWTTVSLGQGRLHHSATSC